jgi:hypothetical protein
MRQIGYLPYIGKLKVCIKLWLEDLRRRKYLGDQDMYWSIILKHLREMVLRFKLH